jgi:hypothetical protein
VILAFFCGNKEKGIWKAVSETLAIFAPWREELNIHAKTQSPQRKHVILRSFVAVIEMRGTEA